MPQKPVNYRIRTVLLLARSDRVSERVEEMAREANRGHQFGCFRAREKAEVWLAGYLRGPFSPAGQGATLLAHRLCPLTEPRRRIERRGPPGVSLAMPVPQLQHGDTAFALALHLLTHGEHPLMVEHP